MQKIFDKKQEARVGCQSRWGVEGLTGTFVPRAGQRGFLLSKPLTNDQGTVVERSGDTSWYHARPKRRKECKRSAKRAKRSIAARLARPRNTNGIGRRKEGREEEAGDNKCSTQHLQIMASSCNSIAPYPSHRSLKEPRPTKPAKPKAKAIAKAHTKTNPKFIKPDQQHTQPPPP